MYKHNNIYFNYIYQRSTSAQIILDPFMGGCTTTSTSLNLNRDYIGIELSLQYCTLAQDRIEQWYK